MDLFHKNLEKWSLVIPENENIIAKVEALKQPLSVHFCIAASGVPNLKIQNGEDAFYLYSEEDPILEAKEWFSSLSLNQIETIYVYGIGLGYYYEAAIDWLRRDSSRYLVFLEDDVEVMHCFLETERAKEMLDNSQVYFCLLGSRPEQLIQFSKISSMFNNSKFVFSGLRSYIKTKKKSYEEHKSTVTFITSMNAMLYTEISSHGMQFFRNFFLNYLDVPSSYFANGLFGKFKDVPAIICGAGPSLNKNIDVLSTLSDRALIFAGGTALNALNGKGVMPHFGCGIDPNHDQFTRLVMNHAFELPFLYRCRMRHEALTMVHGDRLFITGSGGYGIGKWFEKKLGVDELELEEGFNVLNFSVLIAHAMGCNPIICAGIDLAYSEGDSYAAGVTNHPVHNRKSNFRTKSMDDELLTKSDIYGKPVNTLWKWIAESLWYTNFANSHPETTLINATEGGIGFLEVPNMSLREVKEKYLLKQLDLKTRLHGEIQNSPLPSSFNEKEIISTIHILIDSLSRCGDICQRLVTEYANSMEQPAKEIDNTEIIVDEENKLFQEEAYEAVLKKFNEGYLRIKSLVFNRLEVNKDQLSNEEYLRKKATLNLERCHSLKETAFLNAGIVNQMLSQRQKLNETIKNEPSLILDDKVKKLCEQFPVPSPAFEEIYFFDDKIFTIKDPELQVEYQEKFLTEKKLKKEIQSYSFGKIKFESSYCDGDLHGPSIFYSENGSILSKAWFIHGKQEGKMWTYYPNGALHSLQRFYKGQPHGLHQYFYVDGVPKSILPWNEGLLHGEVHLYSSRGMLVRDLSFVNGKRMGQEQIWNEEGQLLIECYYDMDRPVGVTRMWHPNGVLAQEILYDKDSQRIEAKEWDANGAVLEKNESDDYFDLMSKETDKLTASLSNMVSKMSEIAPLVNEKIHFEVPSTFDNSQFNQKELATQLAKLRQELENLQAIDHKLKDHLAIQENDVREAIWKTPSSRHYVEKQFESKREKMNEDIGKIQEGLKLVIKSLLPRDTSSSQPPTPTPTSAPKSPESHRDH